MLEPFLRGRPTGLVVEGVLTGVRLTWDSYPGALCYSVYKAVDELDPYGAYIVVAECTENTDIVLPFTGGCFVVTAITSEGESDYSDPACYSPGSVFPSSIVLARSAGSDPSLFGDWLTFQATVTGNAPTGSVTFYDGVTPLGVVLLDGLFQASISTNGLSVGVHAILAEYAGDGNNSACDSNLVSQTVTSVIPPGCPDCDPSSYTIVGGTWAFADDDGTTRRFVRYPTAGVLKHLGIMPGDGPFVYIWMQADYTFYFEAWCDDPAFLYLWSGRRCTVANPNGNYEEYWVLPGDFSPFAVMVRDYFDSFGMDWNDVTQEPLPACVKVDGVPVNFYGLPGSGPPPP